MKKILVVEDEKSLSKIIVKKLEKKNVEVFLCESVDESLNILSNENIDAVWLDHYLLGDKDGLSLVHEIKKEESALKDIPIFVVSNTASPEKIANYLNLGVNKFYTKANISLDKVIGDFVMQIGK